MFTTHHIDVRLLLQLFVKLATFQLAQLQFTMCSKQLATDAITTAVKLATLQGNGWCISHACQSGEHSVINWAVWSYWLQVAEYYCTRTVLC